MYVRGAAAHAHTCMYSVNGLSTSVGDTSSGSTSLSLLASGCLNVSASVK